ncbi:hypothetical protein WAI453_013333 [Rhynchosporium graminicola]
MSIQLHSSANNHLNNLDQSPRFLSLTPRKDNFMSWAISGSLRIGARKQLALLGTFSAVKVSSPNSHLRKLHEPSAHYVQVYSTERKIGSIAATRDHHRFDPHAYTSGRWLRRDKLERDARYIIFDFEALSGPPRLTTNSEAATIDYLQTNTSIPIPEIVGWSDDASNAIGSEYIIMEHAAGVQLHHKWPTVGGDQQVRCIDAIYQKVKEMVDIKFPAYGSLYFADAPLGADSKQTLDKRFCIGPHCGAIYWDCNACEPRYYHNTMPNQGPWRDLTTYCDGLIDTDDDPTVITGIIDWQSSSIEPAFWYADSVPDFASPVAHPSIANQLEPNSELCAKAFDVCTQFLVLKLSGPRLDVEDGLVAFRHELIETSLLWKELGLEGSCPFPTPTPEELASHQKEFRKFEAAHDLKNSLASLLDTASDGWVPLENWEATELAHRELFNGMLQATLDNESPQDDEPRYASHVYSASIQDIYASLVKAQLMPDYRLKYLVKYSQSDGGSLVSLAAIANVLSVKALRNSKLSLSFRRLGNFG